MEHAMDKTKESKADESTLYLQKIHEERDSIAHLISTSQIQNVGADSENVFVRYFRADAAMLDALQKPEYMDSCFGKKPSLVEMLQFEVKVLSIELEYAAKQARMKKENLKRIISGTEKLKNLSSEAANVSDADNKIVEENVKKRFQYEKSKLKKILAMILPEDIGTKDILAKLVEAGLNSPGSYVTLADEDDLDERIEMIMKTKLFEAHPDNRLKLRMIDLQ